MTQQDMPEDRKISEYEVQIEALSAEVATLEEEAEAETSAMQRFQALYFENVGRLILFADTLDSALADDAARRNPHDDALAQAADDAKAQLEEARNETEASRIEPVAEITPELKASFRNAIRKIHPDLATDEKDRAYRTEMTKKLNEAYRKGDSDTVDAVLRDFQLSEMPDNAGKRLIVLIRQEHDLRCRAEEVKARLDDMKNGDLARLKLVCDEAASRGEDAFAEITDKLLSDIAAKTRLLATQGLVPNGFRRLS